MDPLVIKIIDTRHDHDVIVKSFANLYSKVTHYYHIKGKTNENIQLEFLDLHRLSDFRGEKNKFHFLDLHNTPSAAIIKQFAKEVLGTSGCKIKVTVDCENKTIKLTEFFQESNAPMRVIFKDIKDVDLSKVFPPVEESEYKLLSGMEMSLEAKEYQALKKNKFLTMGQHQISMDLMEVVSKDGRPMEYSEIMDAVKKKYVFVEPMVDILLTGLEMNTNVLLWGPGGHGKSEVTKMVLDLAYQKGLIKSKPFTKAFGDGLTEENLMGGMDIKLFTSEGIMRYLIEYSFMVHEIVVFEEIFDAPAASLLKLKDIMTSGELREGAQREKCHTRMFIGITNKDKHEFSKNDDSVKALVDRFPLTLEVKWEDYTAKRFMKLFETVYGKDKYQDNKAELSNLAEILHNNNVNSSRMVSPRTSVVAGKLVMNGRDLSYISEIDPDVLKKYELQKRKAAQLEPQKIVLATINEYIGDHDLEDIGTDSAVFESIQQLAKEVGSEMIDFSGYNAEQSTYSAKLARAQFCQDILNRLNILSELTNEANALNKRLHIIVDDLKNKVNTQ